MQKFWKKNLRLIFMAEDLVNLGLYQFYIKLMIDGVSSPPFSATTLPPMKKEPVSHMDQIIIASRAQFARPRFQVEEEIKAWHQPVTSATAPTSQRQPPPPHRDFREPNRQWAPRPLVKTSAPAPSQAPISNPIPTPVKVVNQTPTQTARPTSAESSKNRETELRKAMSLDYLKPKPDPTSVIAKKNPSPQNIADLRSALLGALKNTPERKAEIEKAVPVLTQTQATVNPPPVPVVPQVSDKIENKPKEVPEETLRKLLHVEEI